jgi:vacuolar-type H+-ATPase subunit I/STV1
MMATYTQVASILQRALGQQEGLLVLEYFETRLPPDVARQRDVSETEAALRLEIEKVRADLTKEIEGVRVDLTKEIEGVRADLTKEIEGVRADLTVQIARSQAAQTRWAFLFWVSQMAVLAGVLFRLLA